MWVPPCKTRSEGASARPNTGAMVWKIIPVEPALARTQPGPGMAGWAGLHLFVFFLFVFPGPIVDPVKLQRLHADHLEIGVTMGAGDLLTQGNMRVEPDSTVAIWTIARDRFLLGQMT